MLEFFAGAGNVSKTTRYAHISTAQLDVNLGRLENKTFKAFDLTSAEGLSFLAVLSLHVFECLCLVQCRSPCTILFLVGSDDLVRLAIWCVLSARKGSFFALFAVVCTSFAAINIATSGRSAVCPWGDLQKPYVKASSCSKVFFVLSCFGGF